MRPTLYQFTPKCSKDVVEAIRAGHFNQVRYLLELGHNVDARDDRQRTALMLCAAIDDERWAFGLAQTLVEKQADLAAVDDQRMTALHHACLHQRALLVNLLLDAADFDVNALDVYANTPLFYAATRGNVQIVQAMVSHLNRFRFSLDVPNRAGFTPLLQAAKRGHELVVHCLLNAGADAKVRDGKIGRTYDQWLAIALAVKVAKEQEAASRAHMRAMRYNDPAYYHKDWRARLLAGSDLQRKEAETSAMDRPFNAALQPSTCLSVANHYDLRNDSVYVFRKTPADLFHESVQRPRSTLSLAPSRTPLDCSASCLSYATATLSHDSARTWRYEMPWIYNDMEKRCSSAFRPSAKVDHSALAFYTDDADCERAAPEGKKSTPKNARQSMSRSISAKDGRDKDAKKTPRKSATITESPKLKK